MVAAGGRQRAAALFWSAPAHRPQESPPRPPTCLALFRGALSSAGTRVPAERPNTLIKKKTVVTPCAHRQLHRAERQGSESRQIASVVCACGPSLGLARRPRLLERTQAGPWSTGLPGPADPRCSWGRGRAGQHAPPRPTFRHLQVLLGTFT